MESIFLEKLVQFCMYNFSFEPSNGKYIPIYMKKSFNLDALNFPGKEKLSNLFFYKSLSLLLKMQKLSIEKKRIENFLEIIYAFYSGNKNIISALSEDRIVLWSTHIVSDVEQAVLSGRTPVILTKLKKHAETLYEMLKGKADYVFLIYGGQTIKQNNDIKDKMLNVPREETLILIATGQKIGEGFNFPRLDTLMLAAPVKFEGRLIQYVGRLSRKHEGKKDVVVYDYVDSHIGFFDRQYKNRLRTYKKLGYRIISDPIKEKQIVNAIYDGTDYTETFERDMVEADKEIVISSPGLRRSKVERMITLLKPRQESGVRVTVITLEPDSAGYDDTIELHIMIDEMKKSGINVRTTVDECEHYAVIDDRIVWHGGMNLLGKADVYDNLIRVESNQVAAELIEITEKQILSS